jgi:zinc transport system ATP-binding protein
MPLMPNILTIAKLNVALEAQEIIRDLDLTLEKGESLAVIGPNGSGKTVLLRSLLGLVPYTGTITWGKGAKLAYVPQKIEADRHLPITAMNLLVAKARVLHLPAAEIGATVGAVGLTPQALATPVGHLSGGQSQRALMAFALLGRPNVLLLDEPTASIDQPGEEQIYDLVHRLQAQYGITVILVSHDLSVIYRDATRVLCLSRTNPCYGRPQEVLTPETLNALYGGPRQYFRHTHDDHA